MALTMQALVSGVCVCRAWRMLLGAVTRLPVPLVPMSWGSGTQMAECAPQSSLETAQWQRSSHTLPLVVPGDQRWRISVQYLFSLMRYLNSIC